MRAQQKKFLVVACSAIALVLVSIAAIVHFVDINSYKPQIEATVADYLDMDFRINGRMGISFFPVFGLSLTDVNLRNRGTDLFTVKKVRLGLKLLPLLRHEVTITGCELIDPVFLVEREADGRLNWAAEGKKTVPLPLLSVKQLTISGGSLVFSDRKSGRRDEFKDFGLTIKRLSFPGSTGDILQTVSLSGDFACKSMKIGDVSVTNITCPIKAQGGILDFGPVSMTFYGGAGSGSIRADISGDTPRYRLRLNVSGFQSEQFLAGFSGKKWMKGRMDLSVDLTTAGKNSDDIERGVAGDVEISGNDLVLYGLDLDMLLLKIEESRSFSFVDAGAYLLVGPLGELFVKGYHFVNVAAHEQGGKSSVRRLVSKWRLKRGIARTEDVALSTDRNRIAAKGDLDLMKGRFNNFIVAALNKKGCATMTQEISGPFNEPKMEKVNVLTSLTAPVVGLITKMTRLLEGGRCTPFYTGSVKPPG
jgi:uncharacterized protein involved in outer membrane biogenesis